MDAQVVIIASVTIINIFFVWAMTERHHAIKWEEDAQTEKLMRQELIAELTQLRSMLGQPVPSQPEPPAQPPLSKRQIAAIVRDLKEMGK